MIKVPLKNNINEFFFQGLITDGIPCISKIEISEGQILEIDLSKISGLNSSHYSELNFEDYKQVCHDLDIKLTIYPKGNIHLQRISPQNQELKMCYLYIGELSKNKILVCIGFEEWQKNVYRAQLAGAYFL